MEEFSIGYMINPTLNINKVFKEQGNKCMKTTLSAITQPHISKILKKTNKSVSIINVLCEKKNPKKFSKVLSFVIYKLSANMSVFII